jgi:hypothetical protein
MMDEGGIDEPSNAPLLGQAFQLAAKRLFRSDDHGLVLQFHTTVHDEILVLRHVDKVAPAGGGPKPSAGGLCNGIPWGCSFIRLPQMDMREVAAGQNGTVSARNRTRCPHIWGFFLLKICHLEGRAGICYENAKWAIQEYGSWVPNLDPPQAWCSVLAAL